MSFIANVNKLADSVALIEQSVQIYTPEMLEALEALRGLDLSEVVSDLKKGTFLGNRKIDIDMSLNKNGIASLSDFNAIMELWNNATTTVYYNQAVATFVDGEVITIDFKNADNQNEVVSTHGGVIDQLEDSVAFQTKLENTSIQEEVGGKTGSMIRISDIVGSASNLEELRLVATSGARVEAFTMHYWAKTTSALQVVADKMGHIADLLGAVEEIVVVSDNITDVVSVANDIAAIDAIVPSLNAIETTATNITAVTNINTNMPNLLPIAEYMNNLLLIAQDIEAVIRAGENVDIIEAMRDEAVLGGTTATNASVVAVNAKEMALLSATQADESEDNAQAYATSANVAMVASALSQTNASSSATSADISSQLSLSAADRAEMVVSNIAAIALIPLWISGNDYAVGTQVIDPADAEIYLCINSVTASSTEPHLDLANFKRILGVTYNIDGGYASVTVVEQTFDGGTANG